MRELLAARRRSAEGRKEPVERQWRAARPGAVGGAEAAEPRDAQGQQGSEVLELLAKRRAESRPKQAARPMAETPLGAALAGSRAARGGRTHGRALAQSSAVLSMVRGETPVPKRSFEDVQAAGEAAVQEVFGDHQIGSYSVGRDTVASTGYLMAEVLGETGGRVVWPWEAGMSGPAASSSMGRNGDSLDEKVREALNASAKKPPGKSTGFRHWVRFCEEQRTPYQRVLDPSAPLFARLCEEWHVMRFAAYLVERLKVAPGTAASYVGSVQGWHLRECGVKLCGGVRLERLAVMLRGLRQLHPAGGRKVRRGVPPQLLAV